MSRGCLKSRFHLLLPEAMAEDDEHGDEEHGWQGGSAACVAFGEWRYDADCGRYRADCGHSLQKVACSRFSKTKVSALVYFAM